MTARRRLPGIVSASVLAVVVLVTPRLGQAHPMGNFSISHYTAISLGPADIELRYLIDMAEIPTFQELQDGGIEPVAGHPSLDAYLARKAEALKRGLYLDVNGGRLALEPAAREVLFSEGAGGLPTMKLGFVYRASLDPPPSPRWLDLQYRDENFAERAGWKEVVASARPGVALASSSVPEQDRSRRLSDYPTDLLNSPPQILEARLAFRVEHPSVIATPASPAPPPAGAAPAGRRRESPAPVALKQVDDAPQFAPAALAAPAAEARELSLQPNRQAGRGDAFTDLIAGGQTGLGVFVLAAVVAATLGAFHALEPGHGKTVVAAYLVGSRGTAWHAMLLGLIVTASHTAGVYLLGAVTLYASRHVVPERLYPWLGAISGLTIAGLGFVLFLRRYAAADRPHRHGHTHHDHGHGAIGHAHPHTGAGHGHGGHHHAHPHHDHHHVPAHGGVVSLRELFALGITGGIVPCPAALVVLLSAVALRRVGFGLFLIVAFSVGLAAVLIAIGILMVYATRLMARFRVDSPLITRWLPLASSAVIGILGLAIAFQALLGAGIVQIRLG